MLTQRGTQQGQRRDYKKGQEQSCQRQKMAEGSLACAYSLLLQCPLQELCFALCHRQGGKEISLKKWWLCDSELCFAVSLTADKDPLLSAQYLLSSGPEFTCTGWLALR
jgi:hypothetical protein